MSEKSQYEFNGNAYKSTTLPMHRTIRGKCLGFEINPYFPGHASVEAQHMASTAHQNASKGYFSIFTYAARTSYQVESVRGSFSKINNTDPGHATSKPRSVRCIGRVVLKSQHCMDLEEETVLSLWQDSQSVSPAK